MCFEKNNVTPRRRSRVRLLTVACCLLFAQILRFALNDVDFRMTQIRRGQ